jgi:hypothetical protein
MFVPFLNYYFLWIKVPEQVAKAKQKAGSRNPQSASIVMYIFLPDLRDRERSQPGLGSQLLGLIAGGTASPRTRGSARRVEPR